MRTALLLLLHLLLLVGPGLCQDTTVKVMLPDDAEFRKYSFAYLSISGVHIIDSVSSSQQAEKFDVDRSAQPHKIVFKADLTPGSYRLEVTAASAIHKLILNVERLSTDEIDRAVFLTGPSEVVSALLRSTSSFTRTISRTSVNDSSTEVAVQVLISGTNNPLPLWEAYGRMSDETQGKDVQLMPDRCPASSSQLCRCHLTFVGGRPAVEPAVVQLRAPNNFLGFRLSWQSQTVDRMHAEPCRASTCLNGGRCDTNYTGAGFRCICPEIPNTPWGPRCEHPTRSYSHKSGDPAFFTRHWIGNLPHSTESFELSFEFSGSTQDAMETFAMRSSEDPSTLLLSAAATVITNKMTISGALLNYKAIEFLDIPQINAGSWYIVHIIVTKYQAIAVLCPKNLPTVQGPNLLECYNASQNTSVTGFDKKDFTTYWLEIGRALEGCVQSVAINGYHLDLDAVRVNDQSRTKKICAYQSYTCGKNNTQSQVACGDASVCYGVLKYADKLETMDCHCKCLGSRRKQEEWVKNGGQCRPNPKLASNVCNRDPLILSTESSALSYWSLNNGNLLPLPAESSVSIELEFRGRSSTASNILTGYVTGKTTTTASLLMQIQAKNRILSLCTDAARCYEFPPIRVDDGAWHSVSAAIKKNIIKLAVDGVSAVHVRSECNPCEAKFAFMNLTTGAEKSHLRNIRVSGIYMSTTNDAKDRSDDPTDGTYVTPHLAAGVRIVPETENPGPTCGSSPCPYGERCVDLWGARVCECPAGQERGSDGACSAVNPCGKFHIDCPSGGECRPLATEPGFECLCAPGVTSRLCVVAGGATLAPAVAGSKWWIGLIIGIVILAVLAILLVLLLLRCRRQRPLKANDSSREIEKVHEGMGADNENDGVPPEDYRGPLSLYFPPQKDGNGSLPNFQPVAPVNSTGAAPPVRTQPLGSAAATPTPELKDEGAGGDETLNYGYEDTRDDDAADLDEVSIVSADTDFSFDLRPTLEAWGPQFQPLSDILT